MKCPRCKDSHLQESSLRGYGVRICNPCRGILIPRDEVEKMLEKAASGAEESIASDSYFQELKASSKFIEPDASLTCPSCEYNMFETSTRGIVIDFCMNCQSIWFDEGELFDALEKAKKFGELDLVPNDAGENTTADLIFGMLELLH